MLVEKIMYAIQCDNCKEIFQDGEGFSYWSSVGKAEENAMESECHKELGRHYCSKCYSFDSNDNLVINPF